MTKRLLEEQILEILELLSPKIIERLHKEYGSDIIFGLLKERLGLPMTSNYYFEQY